MSKLIDRLNQAAKAVPQPMGFRTSQPGSARPRLLLIASLAQVANIGSLADYISGADAVLLPVTKLSPRARTLQRIAQFPSDIPWGGWLGDSGNREIGPMAAAGCDFVVLPTSAALTITKADKVGKILQVESSLSEGLLRAVNELPVDAVFIAEEQGDESFLTWHHLMLFRRFADLLTKPLLISIPLNVTADELQVLWETGVDGVIVPIGAGQPAGKLEELRRTIDKLTFSPRQRGKVEALLPHISAETSPVAEEEEEEE